MSASVVGALLGLGVQLYANAVQKLPLMHAPWKHAVSATVGAGVASWIVEMEEQGKKDIEETLAKRVEAENRRRAVETTL